MGPLATPGPSGVARPLRSRRPPALCRPGFEGGNGGLSGTDAVLQQKGYTMGLRGIAMFALWFSPRAIWNAAAFSSTWGRKQI